MKFTKFSKPEIFILFLVFLSACARFDRHSEGNDTFIIGSGSRGGNYYETGGFIQRQYNRYFQVNGHRGFTFQNVETDGSTENIRLLRDNKADFAIVQRNVLMDNYFNEGKGTKNIELIMPLFREQLHMYFNGKMDRPFGTLDSLSGKKPLKIGFTDLQGYSHKIFKILCKYLDVDQRGFQEVEGNYTELIKKIKNREIDVLVTFSLPLKELEALKDVHRIYLQPADVDLVCSRIKNFRKNRIGKNKYTLGIWTFLVASNNALFRIKDKKGLVRALLKSQVFPGDERIFTIIKEEYQKFFKHKTAARALVGNLPVSRTIERKVGLLSRNWHSYGLVFIFFSLIFLILFLYKGDFFKRLSFKYLWNRYRHFQFGFILLIFIYFLSIELLLYAEKKFYLETGRKSQILNLTYKNLHSWLAVATLTGNDNGIFPYSLTGKLMVALNTLNFWIGTVLVGASEYVNYQLRKKRKAGIMETKHKNHVVIFGWERSTEKFVTELLTEAGEFYRVPLHLVVVVENIGKVLSEHPKIREIHEQKKIDIIQGDATDFHVLELAKVHLARTVILLSERDNEHADKNTVMRAFAISRFCKNKKKEIVQDNKSKLVESIGKLFKSGKRVDYETYRLDPNADTVYMIAELNDEYYRESLLEADVNEILVAGNYRKAAMKQSVFNFGMTKVLDELMRYDKGNDFYKIDLSRKENKFLVGKNFDELLLLLRKAGILLLGVHVIYHDEDLNIIIDRPTIETLLIRDGLTRDIIINPTDDIERKRKVDHDDQLIVIAGSRDLLRKGLKRLKKEFPEEVG